MKAKFFPYDGKKLERIRNKVLKGKKLRTGERGLLKRIETLSRRARAQKKYKIRRHRR